MQKKSIYFTGFYAARLNEPLRDSYLTLVTGCLDVDTIEKRKYNPLFNLLSDMGVANPMLSSGYLRDDNLDVNKIIELVFSYLLP